MIDINAKAQEISEQLGLKEAARQDALAGIPAASAESPTGAESRAIAEVEKAGWQQFDILKNHIDSVREKLSQCKKNMQNGRLTMRSVQNSEPPDSGNRDLAQQHYKNASTAYAHFKNDNKLVRDASGDDRLFQFFWAVMIVVVEGLFNSYFFKDAVTSGYVGGFFTAFVISIINVGFAFLAGVLGLRYIMNHYSPAVKFGGLVWFAACLSVSMVTVALSAWFRGYLDRENSAPQTAMQEAWSKSLDSLYSADILGLFASFNSFTLAMVGVLCAIIGVWKGYEFDDPYPGFGEMLRGRDEARDAMEEAQQKYGHAVNEWRRAHIQPIILSEATLEESDTVLSTELLGMQYAHRGDLPKQMVQLAHTLLSEYRDSNAIGRNNLPAYFSRYPKGEAFADLNAEFTRIRKEFDLLQTESGSVLEECRVLRQKLQDAKVV